MQIDFTPGMRRPTDPVQAAKLSSECGIHVRNNMPLATHWKQYCDKEGRLKDTIHETLKSITVSLLTSYSFSMLIQFWWMFFFYNCVIRC
jgi:hypothetical protein